MSEQFDIDLKNHISEVFENYEDLSADAGWQLLRQRFPEKKKNRAIIWWYSIAAGLLLFAGLFFSINKKTQNVANHRVKKNKAGLIAKTLPPTHTGESSRLSKENREVSKFNKALDAGLSANAYIHPKKGTSSALVTPSIGNEFYTSPPLVPANDAEKLTEKTTENPLVASTKSDSVSNGVLTKASEAVKANALPKPAAADKITDPVLKMMADDKAKQAKTVTRAETRRLERTVGISPYAATYFNYAKGSSNQVNVGAGVTTDFKVSSKLKISTGVAIAQNTLEFGSNYVPLQAVTAAVNYAAAAGTVSAPSGGFPVIPLNNAATYGIYFNNYKANLIGLDVPVNLKYQVNNILSVSGGFNSGTFINETYTTTFGSNGNNNVLSNSSRFGAFDFAKTVNLSFGVGYPVGSNQLIVEPFLKYPIGGLGAQNIRFGASGINLKFNFGTMKKQP